MIILGVTHPVSWNNAACILVDGQLVAFAEEERFLRLKHAPHLFPELAVDFCLAQAGVSPSQVDVTAVGFAAPGEGPSAADTQAYCAGTLDPAANFRFRTALQWLASDAQIRSFGQRMYFDHHLCHIASAVIPSGFENPNFISLDGWGGPTSGLIGQARDGELRVLAEIPVAQSWGMLYELVTYYLGFRPHSGEGKTMGLSAYGAVDDSALPDWCDRETGLPDTERYRTWLEQNCRVRTAGEPLSQAHRDLAATLQYYYQRSLVRIARTLHRATGSRSFALAGGVALNCSGNGVLACEPFIDSLFVQPASHDAGAALGAAILAHRELSGSWPRLEFEHAYWGPGYGDEEIRRALDATNLRYREVDPVEELVSAVAGDRLVAVFQGRAEAGPRALGNRSIFANPGKADNSRRVNIVKGRELWRPLAPSVLDHSFADLFDARIPSGFMLVAAQVKTAWRQRLPAVTHVDGSARPQVVSRGANELLFRSLTAFERKTGLPALLNTSFNLRGEPLVNAPGDAISTFCRSGLDALIIGSFMLEKRSVI